MKQPLVLVANPGSASRKYGLFEGDQERATLHFELENDRVVCTLHQDTTLKPVDVNLPDLALSLTNVDELLRSSGVLAQDEHIDRIGLRIVAPSSYFLRDHLITDDVIAGLETTRSRAPLHIDATLDELRLLQQHFPDIPIVGVSDSAFHTSKPDYAWNYGINLDDADRFEIKRYGYHGLSVASIVDTLRRTHKLPPKVVVCHLGSGASITAVHQGRSIDTTMGYSPLEGAIMGTRSGSIDPTAVRVLRDALETDDAGIEQYLNRHCGLLGFGGSTHIPDLLDRAADGDRRASLALDTYVYALQKAIGQMVAALNGIDVLVFTGTIGERSAPIRDRTVHQLRYLDFLLDDATNDSCTGTPEISTISRLTHSKPVFVIPANEAAQIARRACVVTLPFDSH